MVFNKPSPVQEGSQPYYQCLAASKVIQAEKAGAAELKAEKAGWSRRFGSFSGDDFRRMHVHLTQILRYSLTVAGSPVRVCP